MIIKKLELRNFQVIESFDADFEGNVYFITGDNEKGKSTILKSIGIMLTGNRDAVLKNGEEKGFAKMVVGDDGENYEVNLSFTKANPRGTLTIKSQKTGMKSDSISMLQSIFGYTDFDAVEFSRWSETAEGRRKQIAAVKSLLPKPVQERISEIDQDVADKKESRKQANSEVKTYTSICADSEKNLEPGDIKKFAKPVDITALMEKQQENARLIEKAKTVRQTLAQRIEQLGQIEPRKKAATAKLDETCGMLEIRREEAKRKYEEELKQINDLDTEATKLYRDSLTLIEQDKADFETRKTNAENWLKEYEANNPEKSEVADQLKQSEDHNKKHVKVSDYIAKKKLKTKAEDKANGYDKEISQLLKERETLIAESKLPIDGLTFTDDGLELNGVPLVAGKVSDSQIMEIAAKLIIASNPTVKVFRIARGESLGEQRLQAIIDIAQRNGFQGFIEEVKRGQDELVIEEYNEQ